MSPAGSRRLPARWLSCRLNEVRWAHSAGEVLLWSSANQSQPCSWWRWRSRHRREGAIIGAIGLLAFALVVAFGIKPLGAVVALIAAAIAWLVVSLTIYVAVMA